MIVVAAVLTLGVMTPLGAQFVPTDLGASPAVQRAMDMPGLTEDERRDLRIRHGQWSDGDLDTPRRRAEAMLHTWSLDHAAFEDPNVPVELRAEALLRVGRASEAVSLLAGCESADGAMLRAQALAWLGRVDEAREVAASLEQAPGEGADAAELMRAARAVILLGMLEQVDASRWRRAADRLGQARQLDRLDARVPALEGELLVTRHNRKEGVPALQQALQLDPRSSMAWYQLGRAALDAFDFDSAGRAADAMRRLNPVHPLADLLDAERLLLLEDVDGAEQVTRGLLERHPVMPEAMAMWVAVAARQWNETEVERRLQSMDAAFPGQALGLLTAGRLLALHRQYEWSDRLLQRAIERRPAWAAPRSELAQMLTQTGDDDRTRAALAEAVRLDPFDTRSAFSNWLMEEMAGYRTIETPHFRIRVKPGVDEVVAEAMPEALEAMHREVTGWFGHEPSRRTTIEVLPDHAFFGVRITGMPGIHTMAAATGPVIAMEVPRRGNPRKHLGTFDWLEVLRHEYTHTVTLSQTGNRIPHWLTEALAVRMETRPRSMETCELLARSLATGRLFTLDRIKWAFVRPVTPQDRPLGYAQGAWMVEFIEDRWGADRIPALLERYRQGDSEDAALQAVLGVGADGFFEAFLDWAGAQVRAWGMDPRPSMETLVDELRQADPSLREQAGEARLDRLDAVARTLAESAGAASRVGEPPLEGSRWPAVRLPSVQVSDEQLDAWLAEHPEHPDLLELKVRRRLAEQPQINETTRGWLASYARARPVDPMPDRELAAWLVSQGRAGEALANLRRLDAMEERDPAYAIEVARILRAQGDTAGAMRSVEKATRVDGYDPSTRELAAAIAIEAGELSTAMRHLEALQRLEPGQARHVQRIERLRSLMGQAVPTNPAD